MARSDVQALIQRIEDANKSLDYVPPVEPVVSSDIDVATLPAVDVAKLPDVIVTGLAKQLEAIAKRKPDNKDIVEVLARVAAELSNKPDNLDLSGIISALDKLVRTESAPPNYLFTVNRDGNGFISTVDAKVVSK